MTDADIAGAILGMTSVCRARRTFPLFLVGTCVVDGKSKASLVKPSTIKTSEVVGILRVLIKSLEEQEGDQ